MSSNVEQIKERLGIADVVGSYLKLEKAGSNYKAKCPFHNEKTPSFFVSPSRGSFYCFGCQIGGDIFSFVEKFEGLDFVGALKVLAERAGVELTRENPKTKSEREGLYQTLEAALRFFEKSLGQNTKAKEYLAKRGVKETTMKDWRLGFAPNEWRALHDALREQGFSPDLLQKTGLIKKSEKDTSFYDIFRGRVMFPIFDSSGRVIAFSGRIMPELDDGKTGKYINSPETILFNKSRVLYGLHKAKFDIRKRDYSIMVEGQMDLVMSHHAGFTNTVAVSGTALSSDKVSSEAVTNLGLLTRLSNNLILAFDSDEAGFRASLRSAKIALSIGMDVKVAKMPSGEDPADIILRSPEEWKNIIKNSKQVIDFLLESLLEKKLPERELGKRVRSEILPYIAALRSAIDQSHFIAKVAKAALIKEQALWEELGKLPTGDGDSGVASLGGNLSERASSEESDRKNLIARKILAVVYWQEEKDLSSIFAARLRKKLLEILGESGSKSFLAENEEKRSELSFEAELSYGNSSRLETETEELVLNLEEEHLKEKLAAALQKLYGAERSNAAKEVSEALSLCRDLSARIAALKNRRHFPNPTQNARGEIDKISEK